MFLSKSASGIYQLYYTTPYGKRTKVSTHTKKKDEAYRFLLQFDTEQERRKHCTLKEFISEFFEYVQSTYHYRTYLIYSNTIRRLLKVVPDTILLSQITAKHWDQNKVMRLKTVAPVTANIELRALRAMFNTAVRWKEIDTNPFTGSKNCFVEEMNPVFISEIDFQHLINTIKEDWLKEMVVFTVLTGLRRGEVTNLKWAQVNMIDKTITILSSPSFKTKGRRKRTIALNESAVYILKNKTRDMNSEHVFTLNCKPVYGD